MSQNVTVHQNNLRLPIKTQPVIAFVHKGTVHTVVQKAVNAVASAPTVTGLVFWDSVGGNYFKKIFNLPPRPLRLDATERFPDFISYLILPDFLQLFGGPQKR